MSAAGAQTIADLKEAGVEIVSDAHLIHTDEDGVFGTPGTQEWMGFFRDSEGNVVGVASRHDNAQTCGRSSTSTDAKAAEG